MWGENKQFPQAIMHVDGDAFFVACEVAKNPALRGKCVITGAERGIASALSYEAKARGAKRGMKISEIKKLCPELIILPSDYETYSLYSQRMYNIVRRFTDEVDEYGIDECFADITASRRILRMNYEEISEKIKQTLESELGLSFSVGLSINKTLAKVGSKWEKPSGLTCIPKTRREYFLKDTEVEKIWGIGTNIGAKLRKLGVPTAFEFANKDENWVLKNFTKPTIETWLELNGKFVLPLNLEKKRSYASISKTKTFTPPSRDRAFIFSQLSKNIENACIKLRRHELWTQRFHFFIKTQEFDYHGIELELSQSVCTPEEIISTVDKYFDSIFKEKKLYRATGVTLLNLVEEKAITKSLFDLGDKIERIAHIYKKVDLLADKFGKHTVFLCSSFGAIRKPQHTGARGQNTQRVGNLLKGETRRKHLGIPFLGTVK